MSSAVSKAFAWAAWIAAAAAIAIVPLIMRIREVDLTYLHTPVFAGWTRDYDVYTWWKAAATTGLALSAFVSTLFVARRLKTIWWAEVFLVVLVLSCSLSAHREIAFWGFPNQYFGVISILALFGLFYAVSNSPLPLRPLGWVLGAGASILTIHGLCEAYGYEPLTSGWAKFLMMGGSPLAAINAGVQPVSSQSMMVAATLYNSNYIGVYCALVVPFLWAFACTEVSARSRLVASTAVCLVFALLVASGSRTGMLGAGVGIAATLYLLRVKTYRVLALLAAFAGVVFVLTMTVPGQLSRKLALKDDYSADFDRSHTEQLDVEGGVVDYKPEHSHGIELRPNLAGDGFTIRNLAGETMKAVPHDEYVSVEDVGGPSFRIHGDPLKQIITVRHGQSYAIPFYLSPTLGFGLAAFGSAQESVVAEKFAHCLDDHLFSSRGYIWCRALPVIAKHWLIGLGPDVFGTQLEQRDFKAKMNTFLRPDVLVDKPHSFYLQVLADVGVVGFLALMGCFVHALRRMFSVRHPLTIACFGGVTGFLVAAVFNDLYIGVAPVLAVMLGMGAPRVCGYE